MPKPYLIYGLTLLSAFSVYWCFALMSAVAASVEALPMISFAASLIHFGISSWLFLMWPKTGKILAVATALLIAIWPAAAFALSLTHKYLIESIFYAIPIICSGYIIYSHLKFFNYPNAIISTINRVVMLSIPLSLFIYVATFYLRNYF